MLISPEMKEFLESAEFAVLPAVLDLGRGDETVILVKSTRDLLSELKERNASMRTGWLVKPTSSGPVACLVIGAEDRRSGGFLGEAYLDPFDEGDYRAFEILAGQKVLKAAMYDEGMELVWAADVLWGELERIAAEQALDRAGELAERALGEGLELDFSKACEEFRDETPLEKLAANLIEGGNIG